MREKERMCLGEGRHVVRREKEGVLLGAREQRRKKVCY
jgi:hypothetical protein